MDTAHSEEGGRAERRGQGLPQWQTQSGEMGGNIQEKGRRRTGTKINETQDKSQRDTYTHQGANHCSAKRKESLRAETHVEIGQGGSTDS